MPSDPAATRAAPFSRDAYSRNPLGAHRVPCPKLEPGFAPESPETKKKQHSMLRRRLGRFLLRLNPAVQ